MMERGDLRGADSEAGEIRRGIHDRFGCEKRGDTRRIQCQERENAGAAVDENEKRCGAYRGGKSEAGEANGNHGGEGAAGAGAAGIF